MSGTDRVAKKRERRIIQRSREREEMFISDYVKQKYPDIHTEAVQVYRLLVKKYPDKTDVRKTIEHKAWKSTNATILHPAFDMQQSSTIPALAQMKLVFPQLNTEPLTIPEYPANTEPLTNPEHPSNTEPSTIPEHPSNTEPSTIPEHPSNTEPSTIPEHPSNTEPSTISTPESQTCPEPPTPPKSTYADNMRLVIPLLKPPVKQPGIITETLEIVTEETLQGDQQPTTMEQVDPKILEQVIAELRTDPVLKDVFAEVELQFEQGMDIDIDIDTDTRLEDELNWEFW